MADKRLDQENVLTDFDYALIVKGTDVAKISKKDLASVVGGLLRIESFLGPHDQTDIKEDFNNYRKTGIYKIGNVSSVLNAPSGVGWSFMLVFATDYAVMQIAYNKTAGSLHIRCNQTNPDRWLEWKEFSFKN